jgi:DNA-binding NarL/FixJ family response regulator
VTPSRILIADDHEPTRRDLAAALESDPRYDLCAVVADAPQAVAAALGEHPELCLLDVRMPGGGIGAAWEITARRPEALVVMYTVSRNDSDLFAALRAGAVGYLLKDTPLTRVPDALSPVLSGEVTMPSVLVARLVEEFRDPAPRRRVLAHDDADRRLTSREWEVIDLVCRDLSTRQIARRLFVSDATVRSHVASALRKLRIPDRATAMRVFGRSRPDPADSKRLTTSASSSWS